VTVQGDSQADAPAAATVLCCPLNALHDRLDLGRWCRQRSTASSSDAARSRQADGGSGPMPGRPEISPAQESVRVGGADLIARGGGAGRSMLGRGWRGAGRQDQESSRAAGGGTRWLALLYGD